MINFKKFAKNSKQLFIYNFMPIQNIKSTRATTCGYSKNTILFGCVGSGDEVEGKDEEMELWELVLLVLDKMFGGTDSSSSIFEGRR